MDEVRDDQGPLWGRGLAENHELHPLGDTVEEGDESLQDRVVHGAAVSHETVIVLELGAGEASAPCGLLPSSCPLVVALKPATHPVTPSTPETRPFLGTPPSPRSTPGQRPSAPHQDLAERAILQVSEMLRQLQGLQVVEQQGHLALLLFHGVPLGHLPLPLVCGARGAGAVSPLLEMPHTHVDMPLELIENLHNVPSPRTPAIAPSSCTLRMIMEDVLCARHCARRWGYRDEQDTVPAPEELTGYGGRQTQKQTIIKQCGTCTGFCTKCHRGTERGTNSALEGPGTSEPTDISHLS